MSTRGPSAGPWVKSCVEASLDDDFYVFHYKDTVVSLVHNLKLEEYGMHKVCVILEKGD